MVAQIARIFSACGVVILLMGVHPSPCEGWSLLNPFSSDAKTATSKKSATTPVKNVKKEPSALDKVSASTKRFFDKTGEALGLKKPKPKKYVYATVQPRRIMPLKKRESQSWLDALSPFKPEEPKRHKNVSEWMTNKRLDP